MDINNIEKLISLKQEGSYWDFKREWYSQDKKADLLHDIICMANNLSNRDSYIIIGVDEENDYSFSSVMDDPNRRNTQQLVDFLRDKHFAGGVRPVVHVENISIGENEIDVIVVHNSDATPFYLTEKYQSVMSNNIYTRVMDSNTPKNKSADLSHIELLWKKRFGLLASPLERMMIFLKNPGLWDCSPSCFEEKLYYRFSPEFTIETVMDDSKNGYQYYLFNQTDIHPRWYDINLYYHQTMLASLEGVSLDGGRYFTPSPRTDGISLTQYHNWDVAFKYYIKNSIEYIVHEFYYHPDGDDETIAHNRFMKCILVFECDSEKENFKEYLKLNWDKKENYIDNIWLPYFEEVDGYNMDAIKEEYLNSQILQKMLVVFRNTQ
ncbi:MAG: helix-turn-helix domain-containing protein [Anaerobutyricum soehngenii]